MGLHQVLGLQPRHSFQRVYVLEGETEEGQEDSQPLWALGRGTREGGRVRVHTKFPLFQWGHQRVNRAAKVCPGSNFYKARPTGYQPHLTLLL